MVFVLSNRARLLVVCTEDATATHSFSLYLFQCLLLPSLKGMTANLWYQQEIISYVMPWAHMGARIIIQAAA